VYLKPFVVGLIEQLDDTRYVTIRQNPCVNWSKITFTESMLARCDNGVVDQIHTKRTIVIKRRFQ
jgi:hypothetical protein